jgi:hypothetical protein
MTIGNLQVSDGGVITNTSGGVIDMEALLSLSAASSGTSTLNNTDGAVLTVDGSTATNGGSLTWGFSTVNNDATVNVVDASLFRNFGVYNSIGGTLNIEDSVFYNGNSSHAFAAMNLSDGATVTVDNASVFADYGSVSILTGSTFSNAGATTFTGGTVYVDMYSSLLNSGTLGFSNCSTLTIDSGYDSNYMPRQGSFTSTGGSIAFTDGSTFTNNGVLTLTSTVFSADGSSVVNNGGILIASGSQISLSGTTNSSWYNIPETENPGDLFGYVFLAEGSIYLTSGSTLTNTGVLASNDLIAVDATSTLNNLGADAQLNPNNLQIGGSFYNTGTVGFNNGTLDITAGGTVTNDGGTMNLLNGSYFGSAAATAGVGTLNNYNGGTITIDSGEANNVGRRISGILCVAVINNFGSTINILDGSIFYNNGVYNSGAMPSSSVFGTLYIDGTSELDNGNASHTFAQMNLGYGGDPTPANEIQLATDAVFSNYGSMNLI